MLRFLRIRRLAVIDAIEVEFGPGLNILTGETGAGKSILVEAVGLLLGGRASGDLVRTGEDTAIIEAIFEHGRDEVLVRRELTAQGRSRAFVNGELTTAGALKELSTRLIELHGQHEHQTLLDPATHLGTLDLASGLESHLAPLAEQFTRYRDADKRLADAGLALRHRGDRLDLLTFQVAELEKAALMAGEDEALARTRQVLANADRMVRLCEDAYEALYERDSAILAELAAVWKRVGDLASIDAAFQPHLDAKAGIKESLEDLALFLRRYADGVEASPVRLQQTEERLATLERLKKKYGPTLDATIAHRDALRAELDEMSEGDARIPGLEQDRAKARALFLDAARALSGARRRAAIAFATDLETTLAELAMGETRLDVRFSDELPEDQWSTAGIDRVEFYVSPNPGEDLRPLARIVSGGELSRIMLAIKARLATSRAGFSADEGRPPSAAAPGLIFDEVDAGIGGRVADAVGRKLRLLGSAFQVLCITHQPQIAAYADTHYRIAKAVAGGRTSTSVEQLSSEARVEEIARMLGGEAVSDAIRGSAREMIAARQHKAKGEMKPKGESESPKTSTPAAPPRRSPKGAR